MFNCTLKNINLRNFQPEVTRTIRIENILRINYKKQHYVSVWILFIIRGRRYEN